MKLMYNNSIVKRILAYIFDFLLISVIVALFSELRIINPYYDNYNNISEQYLEYIESIESTVDIDPVIVNNYIYQISYYSIYMNIILIVFTIIYYVLFQYFNEGKTIGKALMRIKIVPNNGKKLKLYQLIIRAFIINGLFTNSLSIISLFVFSKEICLELLPIIQFCDILIIVVCSLMILLRKDNKALHDLISDSKIKEEKILFVDKSVNNDL